MGLSMMIKEITFYETCSSTLLINSINSATDKRLMHPEALIKNSFLFRKCSVNLPDAVVHQFQLLIFINRAN